MAKLLFLEGPIQVGKSTLLRKFLAPYKDQIGGFSSQRLTDNKGDTVAFRIVSAQDFRLAIALEEVINLENPSEEELQNSGVFRMIPKDSESKNYHNVFENTGLDYLKNISNKKLILLDEIGGIELKNDAFKSALYKVLEGDMPCIGVIKSHKKSVHLDAESPKKTTVADLNLQLRKFILNSCNGEILSFDRDNNHIKSTVEKFISGAIFN